MNETDSKIEKFRFEAEMRHTYAVAASLVLDAIEVLMMLDDDLLDFLAVEVSKEQVSRAASDG